MRAWYRRAGSASLTRRVEPWAQRNGVAEVEVAVSDLGYRWGSARPGLAQPKINIHTREVTGAEALVRWRHPVNGFISPEAFVPVAEEAGLIIELGEWILRTACTQTRELQEMGYGGLNIAVNISAVQFTDGNLLPMVSKALEDSQLSPEHLELEITESAVMHDPEEVILSLHELSRFGMRLAIDDFSIGPSRSGYLACVSSCFRVSAVAI